MPSMNLDSPIIIEENVVEQETKKDGKVKVFSRNYEQAIQRLNDSPIHNLLTQYQLKQN